MSHVDGAVYHVDSVGGNDQSDGLSPARAWRSLEKTNTAVLKPGDKLLFKSGSRWSGRLKPRGGGSATAVVTISRYGEGPLPRIDAGGKFADAILLENMPFLEVSDLEVTNQGPTRAAWRTGVHVSAKGGRKIENVQLKRLFVHDVNGDLRKTHEGCGIFFQASGGQGAHFDDLLIEGCRVERADRNGICQRGTDKTRSRRVVIRGNILEDIGGDGIKLWGTNGGLIERNVVRKARARCNDREAAAGIWPFACDDTLIQFNEVSGTVGIRDGQAYDSDYWCRRTVFQYNYSFRNEGGFMLVCAPARAVNEDTVIRYNISVHDGIDAARVFQFGGAPSGTHIYNNTVIIGPDQNIPLISFNEWNGGRARDTRFSNNLFIVEKGGRATYKLEPSSGNVFDSNIFSGRHEGLPKGCSISPEPVFTGSVKPAPGFDSLQGLRPAEGTGFPRGKVIPNNGGRDFFGNPVPSDRPPAVGAVEM